MTLAGSITIGILQAILLLAVAPVFSGFSRVMRAKIHTRKGPPLLQNYLDIVKLMKRQEVVSEQAGWIFTVAPYINMACVLLVALIVPVLTVASPLGIAGDLILVIYLFALPRVFFALAGMESGNSFAGVGSRRELLVAALIEPLLILVVFVVALLAGSTNLGVITGQVASGGIPYSMALILGMLAFAFGAFVEMGKLPFDIGEAEQEVQEGPLAEYSGRSLAIMKWWIYLKQLVLVALFLAIFLPFGSATVLTPLSVLISLLAFLLKVFLFYFVVAVFENVMARMRFMKVPAPIWLAMGAAVLSFVFYLANI